MPERRPASPDQAALLRELIDRRLLIDTGVPGVYGRGGKFEDVREGVAALVTRAAAAEAPEQLRFPPILPRRDLERVGYLKSFPHLAGSIFAFTGTEAQASDQYERASRHEDWSEFQGMTDLVLSPAACYPVYPAIAARGRLAPGGVMIDAGGAYVFRREPSGDPARLQMFHQRELVRIGEPETVRAWRDAWRERALELLGAIGLQVKLDLASDPFFGRSGRMLTASQREQQLKFEVLTPDRRPRADRGGVVQLSPGPFRIGVRHRARRRQRSPYCLPWLRPGADHDRVVRYAWVRRRDLARRGAARDYGSDESIRPRACEPLGTRSAELSLARVARAREDLRGNQLLHGHPRSSCCTPAATSRWR